jgi:ferric-dicitrate binding protein FerR (iron transport regulator)/outer membrane protein assembly factor BamD (BamD/ComL family)
VSIGGRGYVHNGGPTEDALFDWLAGRLRPQAAQWIEDHVESCQRCTQVVKSMEAVRDALEPPELSPFQRQRDIAAVRRKLEKPARRVPRLALASSLVFAVLALVAWMGLKRFHQGPTQIARAVAPQPVAPVAPKGAELSWSILARSGGADVELGDDHNTAQANQVLPATGALSVQPGAHVVARWGAARVLVDGGRTGARLRLVASRTDERRIKLERGRVLFDVDPLAPGQTVAVATDDALVTVHGTVFLVDASPSGTKVAVTRGLVKVASRNRTVDVPAGSLLEPAAAAPVAIDAEDKSSLDQLSTAVPEGAESLDVYSDVAGADVTVDGVARGHAPLSMAVAAGNHRVRVTAPGRLPVDEKVNVGAGTATLFRAELDQLKSAVEPPQPKAAAPASPSTDPLEQARAEVMSGEYGKAINRLEALRKHGNATLVARAGLLEAQAYRLSLRPERAVPILESVAKSSGSEAEQGELLLAQTLQRDLSDPRRAAEVYADAQRRFPQGIFREEVAYRLGEVLLSAGENREGVDALERYLTQFPGASHKDDAHLLIAAARRDRLNDCAGAIPHLRAVSGLGPLKSARAELALIGEARCLQTIGRAAEAKAAYQRYLSERPRGRFADEARQASSSAKK